MKMILRLLQRLKLQQRGKKWLTAPIQQISRNKLRCWGQNRPWVSGNYVLYIFVPSVMLWSWTGLLMGLQVCTLFTKVCTCKHFGYYTHKTFYTFKKQFFFFYFFQVNCKISGSSKNISVWMVQRRKAATARKTSLTDRTRGEKVGHLHQSTGKYQPSPHQQWTSFGDCQHATPWWTQNQVEGQHAL